VSFFERVLPAQGPFCLFTGATGPDGKLIEQRHWNGIKTHADLEKEVQRLSMLPLNVFFAVGSYSGSNRSSPAAKRSFWLDLDGKDFGSISLAVKDLSVFLKATGIPAPSIYVLSGHGVHVYWCLDRDLPVEDWKPIAQALKAKCEELGFKADPTATADAARILRAPGSLNRKREQPVPCSVMTDNGMTYSPEQIAKQLHTSVGLTTAQAKLAARVSNDDLATRRDSEAKTSDEVRDMLAHIHLPTFSSRDTWITILCAVQDWSDKSEEGFEIFHEWSATEPGYVSEEDCFATWSSFEPGGGIGIGTLVKHAREGGYGETVVPIGAVPVDPNASLAEQIEASVPLLTTAQLVQVAAVAKTLGSVASPLQIIASHLIAQSGKVRFAKQVAIHWLGNEFVMIMEQEGLFFSLTERRAMSKVTIDDMLTRWMPLNDAGQPTTPSRIMRNEGVLHTVNSMGFFPGMPRIYNENGHSYVNLYSDPPDMIAPTPAEQRLVEDFWDYTFPRPEDKEFGSYLLQFYAHVVQKPSVKIASAPLMVSKEFGTGKTTMMYDIPKAIVGNDNARYVSNKVLRSSFSDYLAGAQFLHFDEIHINGKHDSDDTANSLKNLVTGTNVEIHPKGLKPYNIPNRLFITATSNYEDAITLPSTDERRWGIYYLEPTRGYSKQQREAYFGILHRWIKSPRGPGVLRHIFSQVDISTFNPQAPPPFTTSKSAMVTKSQASEVQIIMDAVAQGDAPFDRDLFTNEEVSQWLHGQTGKTYAALHIRGFIQRAISDARAVKEVRVAHSKAKIRPIALRNVSKWQNASTQEIFDELKR
jgi:hypothetical protein